MKSKDELISFLEEKVLKPLESNPEANKTIKKKVSGTRMVLNRQLSAEKVEQYFWSAMATDRGIDSYTKIKSICGVTFEDVREEFKKLYGRK